MTVAVETDLITILNNLDSKMDRLREILEQKIDRLDSKMDEKLNRLSADVNQKIGKLSADVDQKIDKLSADVDEKIDKLSADVDEKTNKLSADVDEKIDKLSKEINKKADHFSEEFLELKVFVTKLEESNNGKFVGLSGDIQALDERLKGFDKRIDNQEFLNRTMVVALVSAFLVGIMKILVPNWFGNP
ncbi:MAG: hypothetical protein GDA44_04085 [Prochloron sp. SP5CPC1]|nr:hypothetical protein [Candidatus Paraprochloron terpiosi SP5CPC1]